MQEKSVCGAARALPCRHPETIALLIRADRGEAGNEVRLLSLHGAKGLEFRGVFIIGCEDGNLPQRFVDELPAGDLQRDGADPELESVQKKERGRAHLSDLAAFFNT